VKPTLVSPRAAILDTNLVLLFLVAKVDPSLLVSYKRVQMFSLEDISLLNDLLSEFSLFCTTNSVLTEVSNLLQHSPSQFRQSLMKTLADYATRLSELSLPSAELVKLDAFFQLGLTDAALSEFSRDYTVVTLDFNLSNRILAAGHNAVNFNHLRTQQMGLGPRTS
jgi:hypothetical protein